LKMSPLMPGGKLHILSTCQRVPDHVRLLIGQPPPTSNHQGTSRRIKA
jgi:hypothetical protein